MHLVLTLLLCGGIGFVLYQVALFVINKQQYAAKSKQLGTQEPPYFDLGGFAQRNHLKFILDSDKRKMFPDMLIERERIMSEKLGREVSTFRVDLLFQRIFFTSDPKNIQAMLATQFPDYDLGPARRGIMIKTLGDGIFVQDGKAWEHSRAMLRPNFVREQVSDLEMEERHLQHLMMMLPVQSDGWTAETNIQTLFFRLTIDSATEFLFGESVDSQLVEAGLPSDKSDAQRTRENAFSKNFDSAQMHMATRFRLGDNFWMYNPKDYRDNNKVVNDFIAHYVDLALSKTSSEKKVEEGNLKERYVFLEELARQTRDPYELRSQLLNILLAGRDTTASLLAWTFKMLLRHQPVFEKLRSTILEEFGTYEEPQDITFATLKGCQYLQYTLNEVLRLWTIVPGNGRRSNKWTTLPRGGGPDGESPVLVPPQTDVNYSIHVMHRRKDIWGEDADEFKPERFVGRKPGWEFLPFNGGPRICIGQQFALTEASYVIVRLLQRFDKILPGEHELEDPITSNLTLTSCPGQPTTLKLHEAK